MVAIRSRQPAHSVHIDNLTLTMAYGMLLHSTSVKASESFHPLSYFTPRCLRSLVEARYALDIGFLNVIGTEECERHIGLGAPIWWPLMSKYK